MKTTSKNNIRMLYLSGFAIIFVVLGHMSGLPNSIFTFDNWFPYYSFHMPLFLFISGYFYKEQNDKEIGRFILKKARTLLIPYYTCNLFFLLFQTVLNHFEFSIGHSFSFYNWIVWPWLHTQPLTFAIPSWYLIAFFICCVIYAFLRKLLSFIFNNSTIKEYVLLFLLIIIGCGSVYVHKHFAVSEVAIVYLRSGVMLFFIQLGFIYRKLLEKYDTMRSLYYFSILFVLRFMMILVAYSKGGQLTYGLFELKDFGNTGILFYCSGILGIALWLRISTLLMTFPQKINILAAIGDHSKYIMLFHVFGFFILNSILLGVSYVTNRFGFDREKYFNSIYYCATGIPQMTLVYLFFGVGFSLLIVLLAKKMKTIIANKT